MRRLSVLAALAFLGGCGDAGGETQPVAPEPTPSCDASELALPDGRCLHPGMRPGDCSEGFVHDGVHGCEPVLPLDPCPDGLMAVPGDDACRPVMECGDGRWGDLPVDAGTQYVDGTYAGDDVDGSEARPWPTIGEAVSAAAPGALIAVAAGSYSESLFIHGKPVRIWGVCPERVTLQGTGTSLGPCPVAAICIALGADGTEVGGLGIVGPGIGITVSGATQVRVDRVWVHDTGGRGIGLESMLGATAIEVRDSLVERNVDGGLVLTGSEGLVDGSVFRDGLPRPSDQGLGRGITVQPYCWQTTTGWECEPARASLRMTRSRVERNHMAGIQVMAADATVEASVVRATLPRAADQRYGMGLNVQHQCFDTPEGQDCDPTIRPTVQLTGSLIEQNFLAGVIAMAADVSIDTTVVRHSQPSMFDQTGGRGVNIQLGCFTTTEEVVCDLQARANASITRSLIEDNVDVGLVLAGTDAVVADTVVRRTTARALDQVGGRGISAQVVCPKSLHGERACDPATASRVSVSRSLIEQNLEQGIAIVSSDVTVDATVVRDTMPEAGSGTFGDGLSVFTPTGTSAARLTNVLIANAARAGLASFGARLSVANTHVRCAAFDLDGEPSEVADFEFRDEGGNSCGCPAADGVCSLVSAGLLPPDPIETGE